MVKDMNYEDMAQMDLCQVIVETIKAGAIDWQKMKKGGRGNKDHLYGLAQGPVIMYLDSLLLPNTREMNKIAKKMNNSSTPRTNYLDEKDLKKIAKEDMKKDGKGRPDDYEFGKIEKVDEEEPTHVHIQANLESVLDKNENAVKSAQDKSSGLTEMTDAQVEHILKIENHSQGVAKFKMELINQKEQLIPLYLSEKQQKKFLTIFLIMEKSGHYIVYMLDKYTNKVHVIDPDEVPRKEIDEANNLDFSSLIEAEAIKAMDVIEAKKNKRIRDSNLFHIHKSKVLPRFKVVHQLVHGREMQSNGKGKGNWQVDILEDMPMVNKGESAYVALKLAFLYNGIKFVEDIDDFDDDLEIWKAETLYMLLLSEVNEVKPGAMGQEILKEGEIEYVEGDDIEMGDMDDMEDFEGFGDEDDNVKKLYIF
ncbi:hypothetical protein ZWY2020_049354 [Hordeum vulgare]|nr:hypothetical protein ZWY2020_049354 [Hordeum vulgare]